MENPRKQAVLTGVAMIMVAGLVLFVLPPAQTDSEKAFRLIVVVAAFLAAILKWRRAMRNGDRPLNAPILDSPGTARPRSSPVFWSCFGSRRPHCACSAA